MFNNCRHNSAGQSNAICWRVEQLHVLSGSTLHTQMALVVVSILEFLISYYYRLILVAV